jgi:hypothetical protein
MFTITNKTHNWAMALATILVIAGAPFIEDEMNKCIKGFFKNPLVKKMVVFSAIYLNTKDVYISAFSTAAYSIIVDILFSHPLNEDELNELK